MFASVLGMVLSIEFGIAASYALGACLYVVCAVMLVGSRQANRSSMAAAWPADGPGLARQDEAAFTLDVVAPPIQPAQVGLSGNTRTAETSGAIVPPTVRAH
jgi:hypothetical protein